VRDDVAEIYEDPARRRKPFHSDRAPSLLLACLKDRLRDGLDLTVGGAAADDEEVGDGSQLADIQEDDVVRLLVRGGVDDAMRKLRRVEDGYLCSLPCP